MSVELFKRYRPKRFSDVVGQPDAVRTLVHLCRHSKVPHATAFVGPSGCGKTTSARILAKKVGAQDSDITEYNSADFRGIDTVRDIRSRMHLAPLNHKSTSRVFILDELHQMRSDAQNALLKILEDTPEHVYFMLCTTDWHKIIATVRNRCTVIKMQLLEDDAMTGLLSEVTKQEKIKLDKEVLDKIVEVAEGSARQALVILHQVAGIKNKEKQLDAIQSAEAQRQAIELARALIGPNCQWKKVARILKELEEDPESLRRMILGYCTSVLLGGGPLAPRAYWVIQCFQDNFYDTGRAGLVGSAYQAIWKSTK